MGWTGDFKTVTEAKESILGEWNPGNLVIVSKMVNGVVYGVLQAKEERIAFVGLIERNSDRTYRTKVMTECEGPCYFDMPKDFLSMLTPPKNEYSANWRRTCSMG